MTGDLKGKRVLVTGGATGIGAAISRTLADAGKLRDDATLRAQVKRMIADRIAAHVAPGALAVIDYQASGSMSIAMGVLFLGERFGAAHVGAFALAMAGLLLATWPSSSDAG